MINPTAFFIRFFLSVIAELLKQNPDKVNLTWNKEDQAAVDDVAQKLADLIGEILSRSSASPLTHLEAITQHLREYYDGLPLKNPLPARPNEIDD